MSRGKHDLTRRDFIKLGALTVGGIALAGCRGNQIVKMTATPAPSVRSSRVNGWTMACISRSAPTRRRVP